MKSQRIFIAASIVLLTILSAQIHVTAAPPGTPLQKQIKVQFESTDQLNQIHSMGLDIWKVYKDHLIAAVDYEKVAQIEGLGFSVEVISDDAWGVLKPESEIDGLDKATATGVFDAYHQYADIETMLLAMEASGVAKVYDIGDSIEGRDIWAIRISDNPTVDEDEPSVLFVGCHHAREWISVEVPLYIAKYLTDNYATDPEIQSLVDNQEIWIVPMLNPDGHEYSRTTDRGQRKNRRNNGDGTYGVDLNRNYGYEWGYDDEGSSPNTGASDYRGSGPFSEPETRALRDLCIDHEFRSMITYHSYGGEVAYPWGYKWESPADRCRDYHIISDTMRDMMNAVHNAGYTSEPYPYLTNGDTTDWTYGIFRMPSITIELRPTGTTGTGGFELPASDIIPTCEENLPAALYLIAWNEADLNNDHIVNLQDMAILSSNWLASGCDQSNICCQEADIFGSGTVDEDDLAILADQWGAQSIFDDTIPDPDPMSFSSPPAATSDSSISMTATEATDNNGVQYYFACTAGAGHDSGWQPGRTYEDTGLLPSREYTYTVIARDTSASHNQTAASDPAAATTNPPDTTKPDPDPMSFSSLPAATGERSIEMTAALATDSSGVQYYFTCTAGAGHNSQWQDSRTYEDTSLTHSTTYAYKVKARDKSAAHNETALSDPAAATTNVEVILIENIVLPANGGDLESFTSEYGSGFLASDLTNGNTDEDGWACATNPSVDQEFVFSFRDGKNATLSNAVIHGGTAEGSYYSENVEVWTSADGSTFTLAGSDTLLEQDNDSVTITLTGIEAKKIKLVVTSGYDSQWWELAEFVVNGDVID